MRWQQPEQSDSGSASPVPNEINVQAMKFSTRVAKPKLPENLVKPHVEVREIKVSQSTRNKDSKKRSFVLMRDEDGNMLSKQEREKRQLEHDKKEALLK